MTHTFLVIRIKNSIVIIFTLIRQLKKITFFNVACKRRVVHCYLREENPTGRIRFNLKSKNLTVFVSGSDLCDFFVGSGAKDFHQDIVGFTPKGFVQLMCAVPFGRHHEADNHIFKVAAQITFEISNQVLEGKSVIELILRIGKSLKVYINCIRQRKRGRCQRKTSAHSWQTVSETAGIESRTRKAVVF